MKYGLNRDVLVSKLMSLTTTRADRVGASLEEVILDLVDVQCLEIEGMPVGPPSVSGDLVGEYPVDQKCGGGDGIAMAQFGWRVNPCIETFPRG